MNKTRLFVSIALLCPLLWACSDGSDNNRNTAGDEIVEPEPQPQAEPQPEPQPAPEIEVTDVELSAADIDVLSTVAGDLARGGYGAAGTGLVTLMENYPESEQLRGLYGEMLTRQAGLSPRQFAISVGAEPVEVVDESGATVAETSSISLYQSLNALADVQDTDEYRVRFLSGRAALEWRMRGKTLSDLSSTEQAEIGAVAAVHATRLAYAAVGGAQSAAGIFTTEALESAIEANLPAVSEELGETLAIVSRTSAAIQQHYPIAEISEMPVYVPLALNAFANTRIDDGSLSAEEALAFIYFATGI
ncbi:hypothetical protein [Haliea sp. E17]|uniref:hypothetical protein n=1 Tax=Haliea sp. E17 TaxID=3401576 RepID=UPI003AAECFDF